jgi:hypothetical protein
MRDFSRIALTGWGTRPSRMKTTKRWLTVNTFTGHRRVKTPSDHRKASRGRIAIMHRRASQRLTKASDSLCDRVSSDCSTRSHRFTICPHGLRRLHALPVIPTVRGPRRRRRRRQSAPPQRRRRSTVLGPNDRYPLNYHRTRPVIAAP